MLSNVTRGSEDGAITRDSLMTLEAYAKVRRFRANVMAPRRTTAFSSASM
jgi:hypothetical protein